MRQVIVIIGLIITMFVTGLAIMKVNERTTRKDELEIAVSSAVQQTVEIVSDNYENNYSEEDMKTLFIKLLFSNVNSQGAIKVEFMGINSKDGMLDVRVSQEYQNIYGEVEKLSVRKTAICE